MQLYGHTQQIPQPILYCNSYGGRAIELSALIPPPLGPRQEQSLIVAYLFCHAVVGRQSFLDNLGVNPYMLFLVWLLQ